MLKVAVEVAGPMGVLVRKTMLVDVLVVFDFVRIMGVETEGDEEDGTGDRDEGEVEERKAEGITSTDGSVGRGSPDSSVRGVVITGSVPR